MRLATNLYHGSVHDFDKILVSKGKPNKDFGQGFYLSTSRSHSISLVNRNIRIMKNPSLKGYLYTYTLLVLLQMIQLQCV